MNLYVVVPAVVVLVVLRLVKAGLAAWVAAWWIALFVTLKWGIEPPVPHSVITMYMSIASISLVAYVMSSRKRTEEALAPVVKLVTDRRYAVPLVVVLVAVPALAALNVYRTMNVPVAPPYFARTVHPSPPATITVHGEPIDLIRADNPFRDLQDSRPEEYRRHVDNGRETYYRNCLWCHGDSLGGDGMFAHGLNPIPTNFNDQNVLPNFREAFFFWRVSKGAPGMPDEGGPWDSAMPAWENFLTEDEIWEVILFLYDFNGYEPRSVVEGHE